MENMLDINYIMYWSFCFVGNCCMVDFFKGGLEVLVNEGLIY